MKSTYKLISLLLAILFLLNTKAATPTAASAQETPLVLAFYYAWFDQNTWASGQSADTPSEPYNSADRSTIERHVSQAQSAGLDAFVQSWYGPQESNNQTETNFRMLLDVAAATGFRAAVDVETSGPFFGDSGAVTNALATLLATHAQHPAYLRYQGKPVIFFWRQQRFSVDEWATIRNQVDPNYDTFWIAEGTDLAYQAVFDGHHLYSIAWANSPVDQLTKWGNSVRNYADENQVERLWVATAMPGYDDTGLPRTDAFAVARRNGDYYRETWQGAVASQPNMIIVTSFNEWPEGTHIEPSVTYGNLYLDVTRELVTDLRGGPPVAPAAIQAAQENPPEVQETPDAPPDGPYIKIEGLTNVRGGPDTNFDRVGNLAEGSIIPVSGQNEAGDWWQIEFEAGPGGTGWVSAEVVEFVGEASEVPVVEAPTLQPTDEPVENVGAVEIPTGGVNVRAGPGLDYDLLGRLAEGATVVVVGKNETGDWWQIEYETGEDGLAWIANAVVDFVGDSDQIPVAAPPLEEGAPTPTPSPTPTPTPAGSVEATDPINVRAEPSLEGTIVGGLYPGESADVLAVSEDSEWWQIDFPDGPDGKGWVSAEFVSFRGDRIAVPIFGLGTPTPTPGPTNTPTATPVSPTATPIEFPATFAPTATSVYEATSAAMLDNRGTPDPVVTELSSDQRSSFSWRDIPWGIVSVIVVAGILWYQFSQRRKGRSRRL